MTTRTASCHCGQRRIQVQGEPRSVGLCHSQVCGTSLFHTEEGFERDGVSVAIGAFAAPDFPPLRVSIYDCRRHGWVQLPPGVTAYDKDPA